MLCGRDLTKCKLVVIAIVENTHQIRVEGMNVFQSREFSQHHLEPIMKVLLGILDLAKVEPSDSRDREML